jgi:hypothetical protein
MRETRPKSKVSNRRIGGKMKYLRDRHIEVYVISKVIL